MADILQRKLCATLNRKFRQKRNLANLQSGVEKCGEFTGFVLILVTGPRNWKHAWTDERKEGSYTFVYKYAAFELPKRGIRRPPATWTRSVKSSLATFQPRPRVWNDTVCQIIIATCRTNTETATGHRYMYRARGMFGFGLAPPTCPRASWPAALQRH